MTRSLFLALSFIFANLCSMSQTVSMEKNPYPEQSKKNGFWSPGTLKGDFQISPSGGMQYDIPIEIPDGPAGFKPDMGISYDSRHGDGIVGHGFSLRGLSVISRMVSQYQNDGAIKDITLDSSDCLALDGNRLVLRDGKYYPTQDDISQITPNNIDNPTSFVLRKGDGTTMYYGETVNSRVYGKNNNSGVVVMWLLNKVVDKNGNYYTIKYVNNNTGCYYVDTVEYGGNINAYTGHVYKLAFKYKTREKTNVYYVKDYEFSTLMLLTSIEVYCKSKLLKNYDIVYKGNESSKYPYVSAVRLQGENGNPYNLTKFEWTEQPEFAPEYGWDSGVTLGTDLGIYVGDFNGDGYRDYVCTREYDGKKKWDLYLNGTKVSFNYTTTGATHEKHVRFLTGDFDGDGIYDLVEEYKTDKGYYTYRLLRTDANGQYFQKVSDVTNILSNRDAFAYVGDFNGDYIDDFILCYKGTDEYKIFYGRANTTTVFSSISGNTGGSNWDDVRIADFTGDGMCDVINIHSAGYDYMRSKEGNSLEKIGTYTFIKKNDKTHIHVGDFNGDGKADFLLCNSSWANFQLHTSTGTKFTISNLPTLFNSATHEMFVADINGDGTDDFYAITRSGSEYTPALAFINENCASSFKQYTSGALVPPAQSAAFFMADFTGLGKADIFCRGELLQATKYRKFAFLYPLPEGNMPLVKKITDGLGNTYEATYTNMYNYSVHEVTDKFEYPLRAAILPVNIVSNTYTSDGLGGRTRESYKYVNGKYHCKGNGFIGFEKVIHHNYGDNTEDILSFQNDVSLGLTTLKSKETKLNKVTTELYQAQNRVEYLWTGTRRFRTSYATTTTYDYNSKNAVNIKRERYDYDTYGNITTHTEVTNGTDSIVTKTTYLNDKNTHIIGRVTGVEKQSFINGEAGTTVSEEYTYSGANISTKNIRLNGTLSRTENYTYAKSGAELTKSVTAKGETRSESVVYSKDLIHKTMYTDAGGYSTEYEYDDATGLLSAQNGADGIRKEYEYDFMGQQTYWSAPYDANVSVLRWSDGVEHSPQNAVYFSYEQRWAHAPVMQFFDSHDRKLREVTRVAGGKYVYKDFVYNALGQEIKRSAPYFAGEDALFVEAEYDIEGRPVKETFPDGTCRTFEYEFLGSQGMKTTETNRLGQKTEKYVNLRGQVYKVVDNLGSVIEYTYDADGHCTSVAGPNTNIAMEYDTNGNRTVLTDNDTGTYRFEYNGFGQETEQYHEGTGARIYTDYDKLGRVVRMEDSDGETNYLYDSERLGFMTEAYNDQTGISKKFRFDSYGRLSGESHIIDGVTYSMSYAYNNRNQRVLAMYPTGFGAVNTYDEESNLLSVAFRGNKDKYWELVDVDATGRPTAYKLGNGIVCRRTYDKQTGMLTSISDSTILTQTYKFDAEGNLTSRDDSRKHTVENFSYDGLGRLTSVSELYKIQKSRGSIFDELKNITYDAAGNIKSKYDLGGYSYEQGTNRLSAVSVSWKSDARLCEWDEIKYNSHRKITDIKSGESSLHLRYGVNQERVHAEESSPGYSRSIVYVSKYYQVDTNGSGTFKNHYVYAGDILVAMCTDPNGDVASTRYYHKDYLGSIVALSNSEGVATDHFSYNPWGVKTVLDIDGTAAKHDYNSERRGFASHEHIDLLSMVNMNGRMYDPYVGRFLSPDPFVQAPDNTQSLNRYAYCLNNPLKYTDETGYFFLIDDWIIGALKGLFSGKNIIKSANKHFMNAAKIWGGLFVTDPNKSFWGRAWELLSRFTFQKFQTTVGFLFTSSANMINHVNSVDYLYGATVVSCGWFSGTEAMTLSNYISGNRNISADVTNPIFQHEYGHYIQSQKIGPAYLWAVGMPSIMSADGTGTHKYRSFEMNANYLAFCYFNKNVPSFYTSRAYYNKYYGKTDYKGWDFENSPLNAQGTYVDYRNSEQMEQVRKETSLRVKIWHYKFPIISGFF